MRALLAATIVTLMPSYAVFADVICAHTVAPRLQVVSSVEITDSFLQHTAGITTATILNRDGIAENHGVTGSITVLGTTVKPTK
ncbi:MAG TPA: hypothetical protein VHR45_23760 [Thermoanaerobaculia bacterium]|nr:hypothetical protein [Thermoanaerobaculia bacterium]